MMKQTLALLKMFKKFNTLILSRELFWHEFLNSFMKLSLMTTEKIGNVGKINLLSLEPISLGNFSLMEMSDAAHSGVKQNFALSLLRKTIFLVDFAKRKIFTKGLKIKHPQRHGFHCFF